MTTTNQALLDALRKRATEMAPRTTSTGLLQLAKVAALCTLAEGRASAEGREMVKDLVGKDADAPTK